MQPELKFRFEWRSAINGYEWVTGHTVPTKPGMQAKTGPFLVPRPFEDAITFSAPYALFEDSRQPREKPMSGLFRTLAETEPNPLGILAFANKYGSLTRGIGIVADGSSKAVAGETLEVWQKAITRMRGFVELWDALLEKRLDDVRKMVTWKENMVTVEAGGVGTNFYRDVHPWMDKGNVSLPALEFLRQRINDELQKQAVFRLGWLRTNGQKELQMMICPRDLITALWVQFSRVIHRKHPCQKCPECGVWFEVGAELRANAKFCSNACKQKDKRRRMADTPRKARSRP